MYTKMLVFGVFYLVSEYKLQVVYKIQLFSLVTFESMQDSDCQFLMSVSSWVHIRPKKLGIDGKIFGAQSL
jgi:hypothetical protein